MPGDPDELYVRARTALLDAADALAPHIDSLVLVGAQAIYLHTGAADLGIAEYTTDADFSLEATLLSDAPLISGLMDSSGFTATSNPGRWISSYGVYVDLMVPESMAGPGRRGASLGAHGRRVARRARGLEGALVDRARTTIPSLDPEDQRTITINVAGPGALLVAKAHKIAERASDDDRARDKDSLDVFRLLRAVSTAALAERLSQLRTSAQAATVTEEAITHLRVLFGTSTGAGVEMARRGTRGIIDPDEMTLSLTVLTTDLLDIL